MAISSAQNERFNVTEISMLNVEFIGNCKTSINIKYNQMRQNR